MSVNDYCDDFHPLFLSLQATKLSTLANLIVHECQHVTDPDALVDYLAVIDIISSLSEEVRFYSVLTSEKLRSREEDVRRCVNKIRTVEQITSERARSLSAMLSASQKRARSLDRDQQRLDQTKRVRANSFTVQPGLDADDRTGSVLQSIEGSPEPWSDELFCD